MSNIEVRTCSNSLLKAGQCCVGTCDSEAVSAVIYGDLVEHARCAAHDHDSAVLAQKPLQWSAIWAPEPERP